MLQGVAHCLHSSGVKDTTEEDSAVDKYTVDHNYINIAIPKHEEEKTSL